MVTTHSSYESVLSGTPNEPIPVPHPAKAGVLSLILGLIKNHKNCTVDVLKPIVKNYHGTCYDSDRIALRIFAVFENNESVTPYLLYWGNQADTQAFNNETLNPIENSWMATSLHWIGSSIHASGLQGLYDPDFFLPLLLGLMESGFGIDVHRMLECNVVGMAVMSLSSPVLETRKTANHILSMFYELLLETSLKEKNQVLLLLDALRNAIVEEFAQVPKIMTSFVAQGLMILMKPESEMYPIINRFILQRAILDLKDIPLFYELFYSPDSVKQRHWILRLLTTGLTDQDVL